MPTVKIDMGSVTFGFDLEVLPEDQREDVAAMQRKAEQLAERSDRLDAGNFNEYGDVHHLADALEIIEAWTALMQRMRAVKKH